MKHLQYELLMSQSAGSVYYAGLCHSVVWWVVVNVSEQQAASIFIVEMIQIGKVAGFYEKWGGGVEWPIRARDGKEEMGP
jgi:hypothetical protein